MIKVEELKKIGERKSQIPALPGVYKWWCTKEQLLLFMKQINNQDKEVTENGTYIADEGYTGLGTVTVNVPQENLQEQLNAQDLIIQQLQEKLSNKAIYDCLIIKAEDATLSVSGLSTTDTSHYFKRLASKYRPNNSGILKD